MCGIIGQIAFDGEPVDPDWLDAAACALAHRGPDGQQTWRAGGGESGPAVGLGHRRLAIIDLSPAADQPMHNVRCVAAGRARPLTIVFNGEIYNYRELRAGLVQRGHHLTTASDTEVLLHLYEEHGPDCVDELRGMFAFAIWDAEDRSLFCARDPIGKKPLYYRHDGTRFWFASENRAILSDARVPRDISVDAIAEYLRLGFVPGPGSAFAALRRLAPGHWLIAREAGVEVRRYWALAYEPKVEWNGDTFERFEALVHESVRMRLVSDVPLGAFLSGGVDSSAIVAMMVRERPGYVRTFTIGFEDPAFDESAHAAAVARHLGTEHETFVVKPDAARVAPRLAWHYGEPFADSSALPTFYLSELARRHITVALTGDGGDELLMGYRRYDAFAQTARWRHMPGAATLAGLGARLLPSSRTTRGRRYDVTRVLRSLGLPDDERYASWFGFFAGEEGRRFAPVVGGNGSTALRAALQAAAGLHLRERPVAADVGLYLPDDLLVKADIATMAHGLEGRSPLLDHQLMAFCARLPVNAKRRQGRGKLPLRQLVEPLLPPGLLDRPKTGFGVPLDRWFRGTLGAFYRDAVLGPDAYSSTWIPRPSARALLDAHERGEAHGHRLWAVLMLELWARTSRSVTSPEL